MLKKYILTLLCLLSTNNIYNSSTRETPSKTPHNLSRTLTPLPDNQENLSVEKLQPIPTNNPAQKDQTPDHTVIVIKFFSNIP